MVSSCQKNENAFYKHVGVKNKNINIPLEISFECESNDIIFLTYNSCFVD
jgi:hypothetical protein